MTQIGRPTRRLEGVLKVTGQAPYAADYTVDQLLYGYVVNSAIPTGQITGFHAAQTKAVPGIVEVLTHENRPKMASFGLLHTDMDAPPGTPFKPLHDGEIRFAGQPIALVVATSFEAARYGASLLKVQYAPAAFDVDIRNNYERSHPPSKGVASIVKPPPPGPKGQFEAAYAAAAVRYEGQFFHKAEHHNPMELFATTTVYESDGRLTIYDKTQGTTNDQLYVSNVFGRSPEDVRVIAPFVGGGFGSGLRPQYQLTLCVMAALHLRRNVRVVMSRQQMFTFGHRPQTAQWIRMGAGASGHLTALHHSAYAETSRHEDYFEYTLNTAPSLYPIEHFTLDYQLVPLDVATPLDMRAPGGATGLHAVETGVDALAYQLGIDPLAFRLQNYAERDVAKDQPYSSKELRECYRQGAERFGWHERLAEPRSMRRGNRLVGYGVATGAWDAIALPGRAIARLEANGRLVVESAVTDNGQGTYTVMTQIAADQLGLPLEQVTFAYGDSDHAVSPIQGGSYTTGVIGSAVSAACKKLKLRLFDIAWTPVGSIFTRATIDDVTFADGAMFLTADPSVRMTLTDIVALNHGRAVVAEKNNIPNPIKLKRYTRMAHSATFVEVEVDEELGMITVTRAVTAVAAGRIINPQTARSQILGGMVWGISTALHEESLVDVEQGKYLNTNLAEYHLTVHADTPDMEVVFVQEEDRIVNDLGVKGVGEIGLVSTGPAIANAVFHATGIRPNDWPIKLEVIGGMR